MFNQSTLEEVLKLYKRDFNIFQWENEKFKWEAVKTFQDNWDVNAEDFPEMLNQSLSKTNNLLVSRNNFPKGMITGFADAAPEKVRAIFVALFDESRDVVERIMEFKNKSSDFLERYGNGAKQHYQNENVITTYLWLRYPNKYYIYKFNEAKNVAKLLDSDYNFKKGAYTENLRNFFSLYDEICAYIKADNELTNLLKSKLNSEDGESCYSDPEYKTLTIDIGFYISRYYSEEKENNPQEWFPSDYSPEISTDEWLGLLNNQEVFTTGSLEIMKRFKDFGGQATCSQLSSKYGEQKIFYSSGSVALAKRVAQKTGCPLLQENIENSKWWPILYLGKYADKEEEGSYIWRLRDELSDALDQKDLSNVRLYANLPISQGIAHYDKSDFLNEVFMSEERYDQLVSILKYKKNIILQGAPGVGKTYAARRLAYSIMGKKDDDKIKFVQFHQNYSYEEFVMGYKPSGDTFELSKGIFYKFCKKAEEHPEEEFFFLIDEINRGNMSKIFGELLMLIENDYREQEINLAYNDEQFSVPKNLYIIGMMNTADRSLALIDYALRRRFSFFEISPGFDSEGFKKYQDELHNETFNRLIDKITELNHKITNDASLGKGFCIGHSYFSNWEECTDDKMKAVVDFEILPMLEEYWFDDNTELQYWTNAFHGVFQ